MTTASAKPVDRATRWIYSGLWGVLVRWFNVPRDPPTMPPGHEDQASTFQPAIGFLKQLKLQFWIILFFVDAFLFLMWIVILVEGRAIWAIVTAPLFLIAIVVPDIIAYVAIHLRFDTTWYVLTDRAMRLRRGVWIVRESTLTFENIQNVSVRQGPVQRLFGISNLIVETAGGGGSSAQGGQAGTLTHTGLIEGISDAKALRDQIMTRVRASKSAGLGDEDDRAGIDARSTARGWTSEHVEALRAIRNEIAQLV